MPKNCKHCGAEMPEEAHICLFCLTETEEKTVIAIKDKPLFFTNKKRTAAVIAAAFIIIAVITTIFYFENTNNTPVNSDTTPKPDKTVVSTVTEESGSAIDQNKETEHAEADKTDETTAMPETIKPVKAEKSDTTTQSIKNTTEKTSSQNLTTTGNNKAWSSWTTDKPDQGTYSDIETHTEYRYRTKKTITSYSTSLSGYTQNGYTLVGDTSGTIDYVDEFPPGFDKNNAFYTEYNKSPKYTSDTSTQKTTVSTEIVGYLYWHWAYPLAGPHSEDNRPVSDTYNEQIGNYGRGTIFEAFQNDVPLNWNSLKLAFHCTGHSTYSYWWTAVRYDSSQQLPVKRCTWTTQNKLYNYYKISDWSEWSATKPTSFYDMETRTIYRYK